MSVFKLEGDKYVPKKIFDLFEQLSQM